MIRTQVQLTERQLRALREAAARCGSSVAELVREAVDGWLREAGQASQDERRRRAIAVAGRFRSGRGDVSTDHDRYLAEALSDRGG
ncbi:MAG TPA: ribbon-helix-helix protein, CopG family [Longimicrobiales bacterium]|nr:ribbon-helix-helix protein, CopG family [Longimicrobiales bacterium]